MWRLFTADYSVCFCSLLKNVSHLVHLNVYWVYLNWDLDHLKKKNHLANLQVLVHFSAVFFRCTKSFSIKKERKDNLLVIKLCSIVFTFCFQTIDSHLFYLSLDMDYKVYALKNELDYVSNNWRMIGRPTIIIPVLEESLGVLLK